MPVEKGAQREGSRIQHAGGQQEAQHACMHAWLVAIATCSVTLMATRLLINVSF